MVWPLDGARDVSTQPTIVVWTDRHVIGPDAGGSRHPRILLTSAVGDYRLLNATRVYTDAAEPGAQFIFPVDEPLVEGQNYEVHSKKSTWL